MPRFLEEEAEDLRKMNEELVAEAKLKREQQAEREKAVRTFPVLQKITHSHVIILVDSM